jgi:hypothetical protein
LSVAASSAAAAAAAVVVVAAFHINLEDTGTVMEVAVTVPIALHMVIVTASASK